MAATSVYVRGDGEAAALPEEAGPSRVLQVVRPLSLGFLLAILALNLLTMRPVFGIDSSFRVGLAEALLHPFRFGRDLAWPYGPLGFLAGPTTLSRVQLGGSILYQLTVMTLIFAAAITQLRRYGLRTRSAVIALVPFAMAVSVTENLLPEFVSVALVVLLAAWRQSDETSRVLLPPTLVLAAAGVLAGVQFLVKFSTGFVALLAAAWFAVVGASRARNLAVVLTATLGSAVGLWLITGQRMSDLPTWVADSLDLALGYQDAQASGPDSPGMIIAGGALVVPIGVLAFGAYRWIKRDGRPAAVSAGLLALIAWFVLKQGLIRWDRWHILAANLVAALLGLAIPWERRFRLLPVAALVMTSLAILVGSTELLRPSWTDRADAVAVLASADRQADELAEARAELRRTYALPESVVDALDGRRVHAEQWDIAALWGYELGWSPLPSFQTYSTYTSRMDELNRDRLASSDGPDGVLVNTTTVDFRYAVWESPNARVALTCNFAEVAGEEPWFALQRTSNHCGSPQQLESVTVSAGETIQIPEPSDANSLVVAHFELSRDPLRQLLKLVARPIDYPSVTVDGDSEYRLVLGTAGGAHLVSSPGRIGAVELPHGELTHTTLSFDNIGGDIVVRFEEIPLLAT